MPDIDERIQEWRNDLAQHLGGDADILNELESHLRDEMAHRIQQGETPERALEFATARIGSPGELAREFAKRTIWQPVYYVLGAAALVSAVFIWMIFRRVAERVEAPGDSWLYPHIVTIFIGYVLSLAIGALANCYAIRRTGSELSFGQASAWIRAQRWATLAALLLTAAGVLMGGIWSSIVLGSFWSWDQREIGGLLVLAVQSLLLLSIWRAPAARRWLMFLGILLSFAVTYAWFGSILPRGLVIVALAQAPFLIGGLAPSGWLRRRLRTV